MTVYDTLLCILSNIVACHLLPSAIIMNCIRSDYPHKSVTQSLVDFCKACWLFIVVT